MQILWLQGVCCARVGVRLAPVFRQLKNIRRPSSRMSHHNVPNIMTVVVPSPTSSSCVRLSSIMLFAAGCATSISLRMACPSLVSTMPPMGSSSILSIALGPRQDRMISATLNCCEQRNLLFHAKWTYVFAAVIFDSCALRPNCLSPDPVSVKLCQCHTTSKRIPFTNSLPPLEPASCRRRVEFQTINTV